MLLTQRETRQRSEMYIIYGPILLLLVSSKLSFCRYNLATRKKILQRNFQRHKKLIYDLKETFGEVFCHRKRGELKLWGNKSRKPTYRS